MKFFGIFGQIKLRRFEYLILIKEAELIGQLLMSGSEILRVAELVYLPLGVDSVDVAPEDMEHI